MQYTIRNIPKKLDAELRRRAKMQGKSLNDVAVEALANGAGISKGKIKYRDVGFLAGTLEKDSELENALQEQRRIDPELWQ